MSTTYELTRKDTGERVLEWGSKEALDIRVHVKLLNNYPKYFQLTTCKDNEVSYYTNKPVEGGSRIFGEPPYQNEIDVNSYPMGDNEQDVDIGNQAFYGKCYVGGTENYNVAGNNLSPNHLEPIIAAHLCLANNQSSKDCAQSIQNLPT